MALQVLFRLGSVGPFVPPPATTTPVVGGGLSGKVKKKVSQKDVLEAYARSLELQRQEDAAKVVAEKVTAPAEPAEAPAQAIEARTAVAVAIKAASDLAAAKQKAIAQAELDAEINLMFLMLTESP